MGLDNFKTEEGSVRTSSRSLGEVSLPLYVVDMIEGNVMGDGCLSMNGENAHFQVRNNSLEYLKYIKRNLPEYLVTDKAISESKSDSTYLLRTRTCKNFTKLRDKWYKGDKKSVPDDFNLTPTKLLHWYIDDGSLNQDKDIPRIKVKWAGKGGINKLAEQVASIAGSCNVHVVKRDGDRPVKWRLYIPADSRQEFFKSIGPSPVADYQYKWL